MKPKQTLMLGNAINNLGSRNTWGQLVGDLISKFGVSESVSVDDKPFPLVYEEVVLQAKRQHGRDERDISEYLATKALNLEPHPALGDFLLPEFSDVLTTNYDYCIEKAIPHNSARGNNEGAQQETKYSLFRRHHVGLWDIWHVHGEAAHPRTICLGYDHYAGYLQRMRDYVVMASSGKSNRGFAPLIGQMQRTRVEAVSWVDLLFSTHVHMVGLKLSFMETHLWWVLAYRARFLGNSPDNHESRIFYYYPSGLKPEVGSRLGLMRNYGIEPVSVKGEEAGEGYFRTLSSRIRRHLDDL